MFKAPSDDIREELAHELLNKKGIVVVKKSSSAGLTTSLTKVAHKKGLKMTFFEPTYEILDSATKRLIKHNISANYFMSNKNMCDRVKMLCDAQPWRNQVIKCQYLPDDCKKCMKEDATNCVYKEIMNNEYDVIGLTYAKSHFMNKDIVNKIIKSDVFFFDEITTALQMGSLSINIENFDGSYFRTRYYKNLIKFSEKINDDFIFKLMWTELFALCMFLDFEIKEAIHNPTIFPEYGMHKVIGIIPLRKVIPEYCRKKFQNKAAYRTILETCAKVKDFPIKLLDTILDVYFEDYLLIEQENNNIILKAIIVDNDFFKIIDKIFDFKKQLLIISDASIPKILPYLLHEKKYDIFDWGDPIKTNQTQFIITDTINWRSKMQFFNEPEKNNIGKEITRVSKIICKNVNKYFIITPDSVDYEMGTRYNYANVVEGWKRDGILDKNSVLLDYHRSTKARGIKFEDKISLEFHMSRPLIPMNAYNHLSFITENNSLYGYLPDEMIKQYTESLYYVPFLCRTYKTDDEASAYINRIGRIKDQNGRLKSITKKPRLDKLIHKTFIVNIGFKIGETKHLLENTSTRPFIIEPFKNGRIFTDLVTIVKIIRRTTIEYWDKRSYLESEVPLLGYIINETKVRKRLNSYTILKGKPKYDLVMLKKIALKHEQLLFRFKIAIKQSNRGLSFFKIKNKG